MKKLIVLMLGLILTVSVSYAAFDPHQSLTLTPHIGTVKIELMRTINPSEPNQQTLKFLVIVDDQFHNSMDSKSGDLTPQLTTAQKNQLIAFMDMLWTKAENEILP